MCPQIFLSHVPETRNGRRDGRRARVTVAALATGRLEAKEAKIGSQCLFPGPMPPSFHDLSLNEMNACWGGPKDKSPRSECYPWLAS